MRATRMIQDPSMDPRMWYARGERVGGTGARGMLCIPNGNGHTCFAVDLPDGWIFRVGAATAAVNPETPLAREFGLVAPTPAVQGIDDVIRLPNGLYVPAGVQFPQFPEVGFLDDLFRGVSSLIGGLPVVGPLLGGLLGGGGAQQGAQQPQQGAQQPQQGNNPLGALGSLLGAAGPIAGTLLGGPGLGTALGGIAGNLIPQLLGGLLGNTLGGGAQTAATQGGQTGQSLASADALLQAVRGIMGPNSGALFGPFTPSALQLVNNALGAYQARALAQLGDPNAAAALEAARQGVSRDMANAVNLVDSLMGLRSS